MMFQVAQTMASTNAQIIASLCLVCAMVTMTVVIGMMRSTAVSMNILLTYLFLASLS